MKSFYTIVKIVSTPAGLDSISIGMIVSTPKRLLVKFSENKKNIARKLLKTNAKTVDYVVNQIDKSIKELNKSCNGREDTLFNMHSSITSDYFKTLNTYSNGVLQFSQPNAILDDLNDQNFKKLFSLIVDDGKESENEDGQNKAELKKFYGTIEKKLISKVENKVHTKIHISQEFLPSLFFPFQMECLGKNGAFIGAKAIPFSHNIVTITKDLTNYTTFITLLTTSHKPNSKKKNTFFLIADEPSLETPEHEIYTKMIDSPIFDLVSSEQSDTIAKRIENSHATKFID